MARRFLRLAYWFAVATAATTVATVVIAYSVGARPLVFGDDDVARYLADNGPVAGSPQRPASPGSAAGGAGHDGGTSGAAGGVTGGTAPDPASADPGAGTGTPAGGGSPAGGGGTSGPNPGSGNPNPAPQPTTSAPGLLNSSGGSVVVTCTGTTAFLQAWTPKPGFQADDVSQGPATSVSIKFKSETATSYLVTITCPQGSPTLSEQALSDHGGPGRGGGGSGEGR